MQLLLHCFFKATCAHNFGLLKFQTKQITPLGGYEAKCTRCSAIKKGRAVYACIACNVLLCDTCYAGVRICFSSLNCSKLRLRTSSIFFTQMWVKFYGFSQLLWILKFMFVDFTVKFQKLKFRLFEIF